MKKKPISPKSQTDFARLDKMKDEDIDYSEQIIYKDGFRVDDEIIKKALVEFSLEWQ